MPRLSVPARRNVGFKGGRQDGSDEKEVVPDFEQAGPLFLPDTTGAGQRKKDSFRESTPVELPGLPLDPPSYEKVGKKDIIDREPEPDEPRTSTPAPPEPQRVDVNVNLNVNTSNSSERPATPADEDAVPAKNPERKTAKKNRKKLSDGQRKALEKLAGRRSIFG